MIQAIFRRESLVALLLFFIFNISLHASNFVLNTDGLVDKRAIGKIQEIGKEVHSRLGINIYLFVKEDYGVAVDTIENRLETIQKVEKNLLKDVQKPYVILTMAVDQTHVNILYSKDLQNQIDKDEILNEYVVPLLASKDKNQLFAKTSAAVLNGYAQIADTLAENENIKLTSSIGSGGKTAGTIWKVFMYTLVLGGLLLYTYAILRQKKLNKK